MVFQNIRPSSEDSAPRTSPRLQVTTHALSPPSSNQLQTPYHLLSPDALPTVIVTGDNWRALDHIIAGTPISSKGFEARTAHTGRFDRVFGLEVDQDLFATMYGVAKAPTYAQHTDLLTEGLYRLTTSSPGFLVDAGWIQDTKQIVSWGCIIEGDIKDLYAKQQQLNPKGVRGKIPWDDGWMQTFQTDWLGPAIDRYPNLAHPTVFYTTTNGWRMVFMWDRPIPMLGHGGGLDRLRGLLVDCIVAGLPVDTACKDWTRLQRLPRVVREKKTETGITYTRTGGDRYFRQSWGCVDLQRIDVDPPDSFVGWDPMQFRPLSNRNLVEEFRGHPLEQEVLRAATGIAQGGLEGVTRAHVDCGYLPDDAQVAILLRGKESAPAGTMSADVRNVHKNIKNLAESTKTEQGPMTSAAIRLLRTLWGDQPIDVVDGESNLHHNTYSVLFELCWLCTERLGVQDGNVTPQLLYALVIDKMREANERRNVHDAGRRTEAELEEECWRMVVDIFQKRLGKREAEVAAAEEAQREAEEITRLACHGGSEYHRQMLIAQYIEWIGDPDWVSENIDGCLVFVTDEGVSITKLEQDKVVITKPRKNFYDWVTHLRTVGHQLIHFMKPADEPGNLPELKKQHEITYEHGMTITDVKRSRLVKGNQISAVKDGPDHFHLRMTLKCPGVAQNIEPIYHQQIDYWLRALGGNMQEKFLDILAMWTKIDHPLPVVYIHGASGVGKGMLLEGFKLLTESGIAAEFTDALGDFQDHFEDTYLLSIDEGATTGKGSFQKNVSEVLRRFFGGHAGTLNFKGIKGSQIEGEWRLLITANHADVLAFESDMTESDIEAIAQRIAYIQPYEEQCKKILKDVGGRFGNDVGSGTVKDNWPLKIAQHVTYLAETREVQKGERFLIECPKTGWHEDRRIRSGGGLIICRAVAAILNDSSQNMIDDVLYILRPEELRVTGQSSAGVWVNTERFHQSLRGIFNNDPSAKIPTMQTFIKNLSILSTPGRFYAKEKGRSYKRKMRGHKLDMHSIINHLFTSQLDCDFQEILGDVLWNEVAPPHVIEEYKQAMEQIPPDPPAPKVIPIQGTYYA